MKTGIVLVNYNGGKFQNECIRTLYQMDNQDFEVIIVDINPQMGRWKKQRKNSHM